MEEQNNNKTNLFGIIGFIFSFLLPLVGLILSILGLNESKKTGNGHGLSLAGVIISAVLMFLRIAIIVAIFVFSIGATGGLIKEIIENAETQTTTSRCNYSYNCERVDGNEYICSYTDTNGNVKEIKCDQSDLGPENFSNESEEQNNGLEDLIPDEFDIPSIENGF